MNDSKLRYTKFSVNQLRVEHPQGYEPAAVCYDTWLNKWIYTYAGDGVLLCYTAVGAGVNLTWDKFTPLSSSEIIMFIGTVGISNTNWIRAHT